MALWDAYGRADDTHCTHNHAYTMPHSADNTYCMHIMHCMSQNALFLNLHLEIVG